MHQKRIASVRAVTTKGFVVIAEERSVMPP
jgi:hypothetical protein